MTTKTMLTWRTSCLFLILTVLSCCSALQVSVPQELYTVKAGEDVSLTCTFAPARPVSDIFMLQWRTYPDNVDGTSNNVARFYLNSRTDIDPDYEGRALLNVNMDQRVSTLQLTNLKAEDSGRFQCSVLIPDDDEGITEASTSLLVLVPPSPPVCTIQGRTEYWQNINITCKSEAGSPKPVAKWETFSVQNVLRPLPPKATEKDGVLSLFNISMETSGFFICSSTNEVGSATCNITLAVVPGSMNIASTVGIIVGVVAGVVLLGIIVYCCRRRAKSQKDVGGSPETVYYDGEAPEVGEPYVDKKPPKAIEESNRNEAKTGPSSDDQHSYNGDKGRDKTMDRDNVQNSDAGSHRYQQDHYHGSRDRLDDRREGYSGNRDRLDDQRDRYGGSRDRLEDQRDRYGGSRDRLDDRHDHYGGSRDRLDDQRDRYGGSRDRLDDPRDRYGGSRDRLEDPRDRYGGSRDRLDDQRDRYGGSRDRLDDTRDRYGGSRDRLDDQRDRYGGSRDRLD